MVPGRGSAAGFIGRELELDAILDAAADAAAGRSGCLFVEAPSGMGSSRLIDEAVHRLAAPERGGGAPFTILRADTLPAWRGAPYAPFRVALEGYLAGLPPEAVTGLLGSTAEILLPLLPRAAAAIPAGPAGASSQERIADRVQEAVRGVVRRLAADGPVVLVVEDLHVLDTASRSLVAFLARTLGERPVLLVGSYQPDALGRSHPLRATLQAVDSGPRRSRRLALPPLDRAALRSLIAAHEGEPPTAPVLLLVAERSGGSPLVAEEVLAARHELTGASLTMPLDQLVVARAARRSPECRRVLRILAVADGPLRPAELAAVAAAYDAEVGRPAPRSTSASRRSVAADLAAGADEAIDRGFVEVLGGVPRSGGTPGVSVRRPRHDPRGVLRLRHELVANALDADLLPGSRRRMHASVASALAMHPVEAGQHWHRAHEAGRELLAEMEASSEAERMGAPADALEHLELAIELVGAPAAAGNIDPPGELQLLVRAAEASNGAGDAGRAVAFVESAIARHPVPRDWAARASMIERLGSYHWAGGDRDGALTAYGRALELHPPTPTVDRVRVLATIAQAQMLAGSYSEADRLAGQAVAEADVVGAEARAWRGHALCTQGVIDGWLGRGERGVARLEEALATAVELGRLEDAFRARANLTNALDLRGMREEAVDVALRGIEAAEIAGLEVVHGNVLRGNAADALISLGRWREARELAERALDWAPSGVPFVIAALGLAIVETETAATDEAARLLGRLFLEIETVPYVELAVPVYQAAASFALWRGDVADATRAIDEAWARLRPSEEWALAARLAAGALAVANLRTTQAQERRDLAALAAARTWSDEILRGAARMVEASGVPEDTWVRREVNADLSTAAAYAARIRGHDSPATWADVAARWRSLRRPYDVARALFCQAEAHLGTAAAAGVRRDGRDDARDPLLEATGLAVELGAVPLLRSIADVAGRARISLPPAATAALEAASASQRTVPGPAPAQRRAGAAGVEPRASDRQTAASFGLSPREQGVLAEIVAGRTNREIGERLFISEKTVGVHVGNILAKLGVSGRVEAATVALRLGLAEDLVESAKKPGPRGPGSVGRRRGGAA
jgi:DNA-binding CsgD family transcriptional regulator/tetratricopeptide (TPR) repeat protein